MMLNIALIEKYEEALLQLKQELQAYTNEQAIWILAGNINNTAGNLCLHLLGNLNHFIGATLGNTGYIRTRELEFSQKDIPVSQMLLQIDNTLDVVKRTLMRLSPAHFEEDYPLEKHGKIVKTDYMLLHLLSHLYYHIGQINYHRRLIDISKS